MKLSRVLFARQNQGDVYGDRKKLTALSKMAMLLNKNSITWAVGGSFLLFVKGIADVFNDIDIMFSESDVEKAKILLNEHGEIQPHISSSQYRLPLRLPGALAEKP